MTTRTAILTAAEAATSRDRNAEYGEPADAFAAIAAIWSARLSIEITSHQVALLLADLKLCRLWVNPGHRDSWVDLAGYAACGAEAAGIPCADGDV